MPKTLVSDELKMVNRRLDELASSVEILRRDRDMFEDILLRLGVVEEGMHVNRDHAKEMNKDIKADIKKVEFAVEDKVDEMKSIVDNSQILMVKNNIFQKIKHIIKK